MRGLKVPIEEIAHIPAHIKYAVVAYSVWEDSRYYNCAVLNALNLRIESSNGV